MSMADNIGGGGSSPGAGSGGKSGGVSKGASLTDIWTALNAGVQALNNLGKQFAASAASFVNVLTTTAPKTVSSSPYTQATTDSSLIFNNTASTTVTLLAPATYPGRVTFVKTTAAFTVVSATANVVPLAGGAASTSILAATAGKWATLQSDGTNWVIMAGN